MLGVKTERHAFNRESLALGSNVTTILGEQVFTFHTETARRECAETAQFTKLIADTSMYLDFRFSTR